MEEVALIEEFDLMQMNHGGLSPSPAPARGMQYQATSTNTIQSTAFTTRNKPSRATSSTRLGLSAHFFFNFSVAKVLSWILYLHSSVNHV